MGHKIPVKCRFAFLLVLNKSSFNRNRKSLTDDSTHLMRHLNISLVDVPTGKTRIK